MTADTGSFTNSVSDFSLRGLEGLASEYSPPPPEKFTPDGSWKQSYTMFVLVPRGALKVGEFSLERKVKGSADFRLGVAMRSRANSGFSLFQRAEIQCNLDALATPVSWLFDTKLAREANDPPYLRSGCRRSASVRDSVMMVGGRLRTTSIVLDDYLNEFTFRFNRRTSKSRGKLFYRLAQQAVQTEPVPFATLVKPQPVVRGGVK
jgi:hypothetical protein